MNYMEESAYNTQDLWCAASLLTKGFQIIEIDSLNPTRAIFHFKRKQGERIEDVVDMYYRDQLLLAPRQIAYSIRDLKSRIANSQNPRQE